MPRPAADRVAGLWYRQPVLWLGAVVFAASMAGCVWLIVLGARHADQPVDAPHQVFGVPAPSRDRPGREQSGDDRSGRAEGSGDRAAASSSGAGP